MWLRGLKSSGGFQCKSQALKPPPPHLHAGGRGGPVQQVALGQLLADLPGVDLDRSGVEQLPQVQQSCRRGTCWL